MSENRAFARANPDEVSARLKHLLGHAQAISYMCSGESEDTLEIGVEGKTGLRISHLQKHLSHIEKECIAVAHILESGIRDAAVDPLEALATEKTPEPASVIQLTLDQTEGAFMFHALSFALCTLTQDIPGGIFCTIQLQRSLHQIGKDRLNLFVDRFFRTMKKAWPEQVHSANPNPDAGVEAVMEALGFEKVEGGVWDEDDEDDEENDS